MLTTRIDHTDIKSKDFSSGNKTHTRCDDGNWISTTDPLGRLSTKRHTHHLIFQFVSQGNGQVLPSHNLKSPYQGFWRSEVHVRRLRIRIVSQWMVCVHSVDLGSYLIVRVFCFFTRVCIHHIFYRHISFPRLSLFVCCCDLLPIE